MPGGSFRHIYLSNGTIITPCRVSSSMLLLDSSYVVSWLHSVLFPILNYISIIIIIQTIIIIIIVIIIIKNNNNSLLKSYKNLIKTTHKTSVKYS